MTDEEKKLKDWDDEVQDGEENEKIDDEPVEDPDEEETPEDEPEQPEDDETGPESENIPEQEPEPEPKEEPKAPATPEEIATRRQFNKTKVGVAAKKLTSLSKDEIKNLKNALDKFDDVKVAFHAKIDGLSAGELLLVIDPEQNISASTQFAFELEEAPPEQYDDILNHYEDFVDAHNCYVEVYLISEKTIEAEGFEQCNYCPWYSMDSIEETMAYELKQE